MTESVSTKKEIVLLDLLDRILYKGVILTGDITISVADVDLVYLGLKVLLTSVDKMAEISGHAVQRTIGLMDQAEGEKAETK
jgi:gas vesicle structural protein